MLNKAVTERIAGNSLTGMLYPNGGGYLSTIQLTIVMLMTLNIMADAVESAVKIVSLPLLNRLLNPL